jgi:hypothetical protein
VKEGIIQIDPSVAVFGAGAAGIFADLYGKIFLTNS